MFSKLASVFFTALLAAATTVAAQQCSTGSLNCCDSVQSAGSTAVAPILAALGVVVQDLNVPVGLTCDPITVIGVSGTSCAAQTVCCDNDSFNGVIALGCTPVDVGL